MKTYREGGPEALRPKLRDRQKGSVAPAQGVDPRGGARASGAETEGGGCLPKNRLSCRRRSAFEPREGGRLVKVATAAGYLLLTRRIL